MKNIHIPILALGCIFWGYLLANFFDVFSQNIQWQNQSSEENFFESQKIQEVYSYIEKYYYGFGTKDKKEIEDAFIDALAKSLWDKHTSYFNISDAEKFVDTLAGDFEWIGAVIKENIKWIQIMKVLDGSPAMRGWLKNGDIITHITWKTVVWFSADEAVDMIRWPKWSKVNLTILPLKEQKEKTITLVRDTVVVPTVDGEILSGTTLGYIEINIFGENTVTEFQKTLNTLTASWATGIIIDGRNNGWGYLDAAVDILWFFLPKNTRIVETKGTNPIGNQVYSTKRAWKNIEIPLVMLVNWLSASATEIVAWAFQDTKRAVVVGEKTYGKWSVQTPFPLSDGSLVKITTAKWYTPKGRGIDEKWIEPDISIDLLDEDYKELYDRQLEWAKTVLEKMVKEKFSPEKTKKQFENFTF